MTATVHNVREFTLDVRRFMDRVLPEAVIIFHKKISMELLRLIVMRNPVDTGRSRNNWQAGLATNDEGVSAWEGRSVSDVVNTAINNLDQLQAYAVVYLWNNVHYIVYLEDGTSAQAPDGFVGISIAQVEAMFANAA